MGSIFHTDWWLNATAGENNWGKVTIDKNGQCLAAMPFVVKKKYGFTILDEPLLTPFLGPWLAPFPTDLKYTKQLARQKELMEGLIEKLPKFGHFKQSFSPAITNWLPFYWKGFDQTTKYTYQLKSLADHDLLWKNLRDNIRREIRKAQKKGITVVQGNDIDLFLTLNEKTFARQKTKPPYSRAYVQHLYRACQANNAGTIFIAKDETDKAHAGIFLVWDETCAYYLMGGGDPALRNSGATSLAMWEAIKFASTVSKKFDFEGSMIEPVERFFRAFGAEQVPYFTIRKTPAPLLKAFRAGSYLFS